MVRPTLSTTSSAPSSVDADVLVLGVRPGADGAPATLVPSAAGPVDGLADLDLAAVGATGAKDQLVRIPGGSAVGVAAAGIVLVGLGSATGPAAVRSAVGRDVAAVIVVPVLPTDVRHNSKIDRARLGRWAAGILSGGRVSAP